MSFLHSFFRVKYASESWVKYLFSLLHLWLGIASGFILTIVCITGAIYATKPMVENASTKNVRQLDMGEISEKQLPVEALIESFESEFGLTPNRIKIVPNSAILVHSFKRGEKSIGAYYNPYNGKFEGQVSAGIKDFYTSVMKLHRWMLVRNPGKIIVGVSVVIFVFLLLSGLVLWWPTNKRQLKKSIVIQWKTPSLFKRLYDLHRVFGFYLIIPLLFLSITGLYISFDWVKNGITLSLGGTIEKHAEHPHREVVKPNEKTSSFGQEVNEKKVKPKEGWPSLKEPLQQVYDVTPYQGITTISLPRNFGGPIRFTRFNTDNWLRAALPDRIEISVDGEVQTTLFKKLPLHKQFSSIVKGLHTSELFPAWVGVIYCIISMAGALLPITGLWMWLKRASM